MQRPSPGIEDRVHRPYKLGALLEALALQGVPAVDVLADSGIEPAMLDDAGTRVSVRQLLAVYGNAMRLARDPALALRAGQRVRITHFGLYGYALLASATPRAAIDFALKYRALTSPVIGLAFRVEGDDAVWSFEDVLGLGAESPLFRFIFEFQLGTQLALHRDLIGPALTPDVVHVAYRAPAHAALYGEVLGCPVHFSRPTHEMRFSAAWLQHRLALANPATAAVVQETCDQLLAEMHSAAGLAGRVAARLLREPGRFPAIETVAAELGMTSRTLRRRLQTEGASYQQLLDDVRRQLSIDCLQRTRMSIDDIAASLGFSEAANFRQAFKRWTGRSPASYRAVGRPLPEA